MSPTVLRSQVSTMYQFTIPITTTTPNIITATYVLIHKQFPDNYKILTPLKVTECICKYIGLHLK